MKEEEITGIRSKKKVLIVLEVINDVCWDESNAQHFFKINGEFFCLLSIVPKGNLYKYKHTPLRLVHHKL